MIESIATAVLPVWRSPMISSRWPRPIGTIESIDFSPVCIGWLTLWRAITPGAIFSIGADILALIGPLPSIGAPSALTTRPFSSGPIGTSRMRPVHLTVSPSEMCSYSPRMTVPTESRSRFSARPYVGEPSGAAGNSSISPCMASERPCTRQMPSVTDTTVPSLRMLAETASPSMRLLISSEISAGFSCMSGPSLCSSGRLVETQDDFSGGGQRRLHLLEAGADRGVEHLVADDDANAADQLGNDDHRRFELPAEAPLHRRLDVGGLAGVDREGALDRRLRDAGARIDERLELRRDLGQRGEPAVVDHGPQQVPGGVAGVARTPS